MSAVIIGASGQDGYYLSTYLTQLGINVVQVSLHGNHVRLNLSSFEEVKAFIKKHQPHYLFHLAAKSTTRHEVWQHNHEAISTGTLNILESVNHFSPQCKVFLAGSGLQFINKGVPIRESDPFHASSQYAISRIQSAYAARYYRSLGVQAYFGYLFNHDSPLRSEAHVSRKVVETAKKIMQGSSIKLQIGDMSVMKEWGFAGDIVKGMWTLVNQNKIFEANIGTGIAFSIKDWIETCFRLIGKNWEDYVESNPEFVAEYKVLVSDPSLIRSLGWKPEVSFEDLAEMMMEGSP